MYKFNRQYDHEYERQRKHLIEEYKKGVVDPTRLVGKLELKRLGTGPNKT